MDEVQACFRAVFSSGQGQRVLGQLLIDTGYFDKVTPDNMHTVNYAKDILEKCGLDFRNNPDLVGSYVQKLFELRAK